MQRECDTASTGESSRLLTRLGDRGSTYVQYLSLAAIAALILSGLMLTGISGILGQGMQGIICRIVTLGSPSSTICKLPGDKSEKQNFLPVYCDALVKSHKEHLATNIWFLHFGANFSMMYEKLANGEVWMTVVPYDYEAGVQKKINIGEKVKGSAGANLHLAFGQTYQFQSDDEAKKWEQTLKDNLNENNPTSSRFWNPFDGGKKDTPRPAINSVDGGIDAAAEAGIKVPAGKNLKIGGGVKAQVSGHVIKEDWHLNDPKRHRYWDNKSYTFKLSGEYNAKAEAEGGGKDATVGGHVGGGQKWTAAIRYMYNPDGSLANIRWITTYKKQINGGVNVGGPKKNGKEGGKEGGKQGGQEKPSGTKKPPKSPSKGKRSKPKAQKKQGSKKGSKGRKNNKKKVQKNKNNKNQRRQARKKNSGTPPAGNNDGTGGKEEKNPKVGDTEEYGKEVTRMTQLNFDDPKDPKFANDPWGKQEAQRQQQVGHNYIHKYGVIPPIPIMNAITGKTNAVTEDPGPNADPMTRLMYDRGRAWEWNSNDHTTTKELVDSDPLEASISDETKVTKGAKYLEGPQNGHREYKSFPECTAQKAPKEHDPRLDGY